jgi:CO/xanthine dehydrogenase FAD-binding subunit
MGPETTASPKRLWRERRRRLPMFVVALAKERKRLFCACANVTPNISPPIDLALDEQAKTGNGSRSKVHMVRPRAAPCGHISNATRGASAPGRSRPMAKQAHGEAGTVQARQAVTPLQRAQQRNAAGKLFPSCTRGMYGRGSSPEVADGLPAVESQLVSGLPRKPGAIPRLEASRRAMRWGRICGSMKPVAFEYLRPATLREACGLLADDGNARVLAGGQTLIPMLAMRLARPSRLVDIARIPTLSGIRDEGAQIAVGAATRQAVAERDLLIARKVPLLAKALPWVGHAPTRNRGTIGGSLANGDPAAEIALVAVTLEAVLLLAACDGTSEVAVGEFYLGPMITALPEASILTTVRFPVWGEGRIGTGFHEVAARMSDFALVAAAAQVALDAEGRCTALAVGLGGAADTPLRLASVATALIGSGLDEADVRAAVEAATADLETADDLHASAAYRRRVAATLARRAILDARNEAAGEQHAG